MPFFRITASVHASSYVGVVEADTAEMAVELVDDARSGENLQLCWQCAEKIEDPAYATFEAEEVSLEETADQPDAISDGEVFEPSTSSNEVEGS